MDTKAQFLEGWAIVELFGHSVTAGFVSEQLIAGTTFLRVDVPECDGAPGFTKFYGGNAIYALTPTTEETARAAVASLRPEPVSSWQLSLRQLVLANQTDPQDDELDVEDHP